MQSGNFTSIGNIKRRNLLKAGLCSALLAAPYARLAQAAGVPVKLVLLGTKGGPRVGDTGANAGKFTRMNPSNLLLIGGVPYVIDCGYGVSQQLQKAGVALPSVRYVFITHHHSDHQLEYGNLLYNAWASGLNHAVDTYGPPGLEQMTRDFMALNHIDIDTRIGDEGKPDLRKLVQAHDITNLDQVLSNEQVKVTAMHSIHPPFSDAYAYKFDIGGKIIVFSGDTAYNPKLTEFARGADYLVHEVMYAPALEALAKRVPNAKTIMEHFLASHTVTEDVGRIAAAAQVKNLVLSHFVPGDDPSITDAMWAEGVRKHYQGTLFVGRDLMEFDL
ncbi:MBL fold metallo-hydrolase [Undibacterium sp.]|uniref:MBL fold metallo-hydrolase n=1 Tax=Undibacterium sp. TaxID=1914977 RepID=UPI00374CC235